MFLKRKSYVIFRNYDSFGYITDNRNYGYVKIDDNENYIGDKILSESGSVFFSVLDNKPQNFNELVKEISNIFTDADITTIEKDAKDFYFILEQGGFIVSGKTIQECEDKDTKFSYKKSEQINIKQNSSPFISRQSKTTKDFLTEHFNGKPQLTSLHIEINSICNEKCIHCYIPHENKISWIDSNLFYNILDQCKDMRLLHLTLSGGEPMLHNDFCDFLRKIKEYNFSVNILSNLTLVNDEILEEMKGYSLLSVQVSLYSMNADIHDQITQVKGSYEKTIDAIYKLLENNIPMQISCPIMKQNKNCYDDVIKWAKKHNVNVNNDYIIIAQYDHVLKNLDCRLSINEIRDVLENKIKNNINYLEEIEKEAEKKKEFKSDDFVCTVCDSSLCVADNGMVYPCVGWQSFILGNLYETHLHEIWNNSKKVQYLRELRKHDFPLCIKCDSKEYCTMCMVRNANESPYGNPLDVNEYFCNVVKLHKEIVSMYKKP